MMTHVPVVSTSQGRQTAEPTLVSLIQQNRLPLRLDWLELSDLRNKTVLKTVSSMFAPPDSFASSPVDHAKGNQTFNGVFLLLQTNTQNQCAITLCMQNPSQPDSLMKVGVDWHKMQRRVVRAGRKSELLLQACKLNQTKVVLDATAGFGQDSLILASTGAQVVMVEQNPLMVLLLLFEQRTLHTQKNWQSLMSRLHIGFGEVTEEVTEPEALKPFYSQLQDLDTIYLDPMFPNASFASQVSKPMQILHQMTHPPCQDEENRLLTWALGVLNQYPVMKQVIVKRPKGADWLAGVEPSLSWENDAVRFDGYYK